MILFTLLGVIQKAEDRFTIYLFIYLSEVH